MEAARAAWIEAAPDAGERERREKSNTLKYVCLDGDQNVFADSHGLRHTGITFVVRKRDIRVGQVWADHCSPVLTAAYADVDLGDLIDAISGLPVLPTKKTNAKEAPLTSS
jgi:hypothetical protein